MNATKLYRENEKMIRSMAGKVSRITGIEKDEVEAQGNLIFCECLQRYEENRGDFSKYLSTSLHFGLYKFAKCEAEISDNFIVRSDEEMVFGNGMESKIDTQIREKLTYVPDYTEIVDATFKNLSTDSQYICGLTLCPEIKVRTKTYKSEKITKKDLTNHLRSEGWKFSRIERAFYEISAYVGST